MLGSLVQKGCSWDFHWGQLYPRVRWHCHGQQQTERSYQPARITSRVFQRPEMKINQSLLKTSDGFGAERHILLCYVISSVLNYKSVSELNSSAHPKWGLSHSYLSAVSAISSGWLMSVKFWEKVPTDPLLSHLSHGCWVHELCKL